MENINLKNIISPNKKLNKNHIIAMAEKMLTNEIMPCLRVIEIPNSSNEKLYKLYPPNEKQALFLAVAKQANSLKPLEKSYSQVFCQVI